MRGRFHHASPRDDAGFTLVELLVSMVVVTLILSSISMALYLALHNIDSVSH